MFIVKKIIKRRVIKKKTSYISLKKAREILGCSKGYLTYLCRKKKLKARKIGAEWLTTQKWIREFARGRASDRFKNFRKKDLTSKTLHLKPSKERGLILPLYFGWALQIKVSLIKYHSYIRKLFGLRSIWQEAITLILILALVGSGFLFFQNVKNILAATFYWAQLSWSGGADTVNFPVHPTNQEGWTKFYSKDAGITAGTELTLTTTTSGSVAQTSDADFNAGTKDNVYVSGGNVYLQKPLGKTCSADIECVSGYCVDGVCCDTACTGLCQACSVAKKHQGVDGTCGFVANGYESDNECSQSSCSVSVVVNSASVETCNTVCADYTKLAGNCDGAGNCSTVAACGCTSVGTDANGTNQLRWDISGGDYTHCHTDAADCSSSMVNLSYFQSCSGYKTEWTNCLCW